MLLNKLQGQYPLVPEKIFGGFSLYMGVAVNCDSGYTRKTDPWMIHIQEGLDRIFKKKWKMDDGLTPK